MRSKLLLAVTLVLPFATTPSAANAGRTHSHWQKTARVAVQVVPNAQAYYAPLVADPYAADPYATWGPMLCTYQGGPKSNTWACR